MKIFLRLLGKMPKKKRSADSYEQSTLSYQLTAKYQISKTHYLAPFLLFILVFVSCAALAQEPVVHTAPAAQAESEITPLKIGDKIPDELWEMYFPVVSAKSDQVQYLSLGDFKDKLIILDFWSTWCAPCISSLHKLDTLQEQFKKDLMVIPTSYEPESKIRPFLMNRKLSLISLIDEKELRSYFPYKFIPHQVWIKNNIVRAIVEPMDLTASNIEKILKDDSLNLYTKKDVLDYSASTPLAVFADRLGVPIMRSSTMTPFIDGIPSSIGIRKGEGKVLVNFTNVNLISMYNRILGGSKNNRIQLEDKVLEKYAPLFPGYLQEERTFCYQLHLLQPNEFQVIKQQVLEDLGNYFDLQLDSQIVNMDCYVISKNTEVLKERPTNGLILEVENGQQKRTISSLVSSLNFSILWTPDQNIFIDESDFEDKIMARPYTELQKDIPELRAALLPYGLMVKRQKRPLMVYKLSEKKNK